MNNIVQIAVIVLTIISTVTTIGVYLARNELERSAAVYTTLTSITIVLGIEVFYHISNPRPSEYTIQGGVMTELILLILLVLYEWIPTLYRLDKYEGRELYITRERRVRKVFAGFGVLVAVLTFAMGIFFYIGNWEAAANAMDAYGLLFIVPTLGVGEAFMMRYGQGAGLVSCFVLCAPILYLAYTYLDSITFITYLTTATAFFSDSIIGCRHFLKSQYEMDRRNYADEDRHSSDNDSDV